MKIHKVDFLELETGNRYTLFDTSVVGLRKQMAKTRKEYNYDSDKVGFYEETWINFNPTKKGILDLLKKNFTNATTNS